jgi:pyruvate dehydrogenase (quinone)
VCGNIRTRCNKPLNGLYDAKSDNTPVIAITESTYSDMMGSGYQQDINLPHLFSDVAVYNNMINGQNKLK